MTHVHSYYLKRMYVRTKHGCQHNTIISQICWVCVCPLFSFLYITSTVQEMISKFASFPRHWGGDECFLIPCLSAYVLLFSNTCTLYCTGTMSSGRIGRGGGSSWWQNRKSGGASLKLMPLESTVHTLLSLC